MKRNLIWATISVILATGFGCSTSPGPDNRQTVGPSNAVRNSPSGPNDPGSTDPASPPANFNPRGKPKVRVDANPDATPEPPVFRPAPENSESATIMTDDGSILEIRVFKSHPQIAKVEASWVDPKEKLLKVYLKSGRVIEVKTDRIATLRSASVIEILEVAGIRNSQRLADPSRLVDKK